MGKIAFTLMLGLTFCMSLVPGSGSDAEASNAKWAKEIVFPAKHSTPAEVLWQHSHVLQIIRTRETGPGGSWIVVLDSEGKEKFTRYPGKDIPGAQVVTLLGATLTKSLHVVVSMVVFGDDNTGESVLAIYDVKTGKPGVTVRDCPVSCDELAGNTDDTFWCIGPNIRKLNSGSRDFDIVYRFTLEGELMGSMFNLKAFPKDHLLPYKARGTVSPALVVSGDQARLYMPAMNAVLEWSGDGSVRNIRKVGDRVAEYAEYVLPMKHSEAVAGLFFVSTSDPETRNWRRGFFLSTANGARADWSDLRSEMPSLPIWFRLIGQDERGLILWDKKDRRMVWLPLGASFVE